MCGIIDDILPVLGGVLGGVVGSVVPGLGTAWGAALGSGLGGFAGNYAQNHNFGSALGAGVLSGGAQAIGGGLAQGLGGAATEGAGTIGSGAFSTGLESAAPGTLGDLESGLGGGALFGAGAGTGTAIGGEAAANIGANGLGVAGQTGGALSDVLGGNGQFTSALGGGNAGTGMNPNAANSGLLSQSAAPQLGGGSISGESSQGIGQGGTNMGTLSNTGVNPATQSSNPYGFTEGTSMGVSPESQGGLSTLYGPGGDPAAAQAAMTGGAGMQAAPAQPVSINGSTGGASHMGDDFDWGSPQGLQALFGLARSGVGAYQQFQQGQLAKQYANDINQQFAPDSPYAQQMQQTLARQDAAAGRNSQYGTRAVQLAAALAQARAQAMGNSNYAQARQNNSGANVLNSLFYNFGNNPAMARGVQSLGSSAFNGLASLFGG